MLKLVTLFLAFAIVVVGPRATASNSSQATAGIAFEREGDLYAVALNGGHEVRLTKTPVWDETSPSASPDGRWIAYAREGPNSSTIWIRSLDGRMAKRITRGWDADPAWSPDGRHLYFARYLSQDDEGPSHSFHEDCGSLFRVRVDGGEPAQRLTNDPSLDSFHSHWDPAVSPDGSRIAFTDANQCSGGTTSVVLRVTDVYGRPSSDLSRLRGNDYDSPLPFGEYGAPAWSPDGGRVAFVSGWGDTSFLGISNRDGSDLRRVTPKGVSGGDSYRNGPTWSPDGRWIAFGSDGRRDSDIYVIHPNGTGLRRLTMTKAARESSPTWLREFPVR